MKKRQKLRIDKLFLYRHRFQIGYIVLGLVFIAILAFLPRIAMDGLSEAEMASAVSSNQLNFNSIAEGNLINAPYHLLQKASMAIFGLTLYSVKLPSLILGLATAIILILLLNRWFKNNVALLASIITVLSPIFLYLAASGTPAILYIFWLALILWLGAKIVGEKHQSPIIFIALIITIALSLYTPHLIYIAILIGISGIIRPHIRFTIKKIKIPQFLVSLSALLIFALPLIITCIVNPTNFATLLYTTNSANYLDNVSSAFTPFFSFGTAIESPYLSPLFGLATIALIIIGIVASAKVLFTSRNTANSLLVIFAIFVSGINPDAAVIIFIPAAILVAAGIESVLEKWYSLFPENPYARVAGIIPIATFIIMIVASGFIYTIYGYRYVPNVAKQFNDDISLINTHLPTGTVLLVPADTTEYHFYKILENTGHITVSDTLPDRTESCIATLGRWQSDINLPLTRLITSSKSQNSDRLYIYNCN